MARHTWALPFVYWGSLFAILWGCQFVAKALALPLKKNALPKKEGARPATPESRIFSLSGAGSGVSIAISRMPLGTDWGRHKSN